MHFFLISTANSSRMPKALIQESGYYVLSQYYAAEAHPASR